jgi:hypothetical protein
MEGGMRSPGSAEPIHETDREKLAVDENYFPDRNEIGAANRKTFS